MFCRFCGAQLEEGVTLCPVCNRELSVEEETVVEETTSETIENDEVVEETTVETPTEEPKVEKKEEKTTEGKGAKPWVVFLTAFCGALAGVILVCAILYASGVAFRGQPDTEIPATEPTLETQAPTQETEPVATEPAVTVEASGENDIYNKVSYTVTDEDASNWSDKVIATVGDMQLTNSELQLYYWSNVYDFLNNYSYYLSSMGLDYTKPLDQQMYMDGTMTWQQFFLEGALLSWHKYCVLNMDAEANNFVLSQETVDFFNELPETTQGVLEGTDFETFEELLKADMGAVCTEDGYYTYMQNYYCALEYFNALYETLVPTEAEVLRFFEENADSFAESGITMDSGKYYAVRHILIEPKGGETAEDGSTTYTDAQWEACRMEAQAILDQWLAEDGTEEGFAALAAQLSTDGGSAENGGLYEGLTSSTNFVTEFKEWYLDESRVPGSSGLVKSVYGYHIMFFSGSEEIWHYESFAAAQQDKANSLIEEMMNTNTMEVAYENIAIGHLDLA